MIPTRKCTLCKVKKPTSEFYKRPDGSFLARCKPCHLASQAAAKANAHRSKPLSETALAVLRACNTPTGATQPELCEALGKFVSGQVTTSLVERGLVEELLIPPRNTGELQRASRPRKKWRTLPKGRELITQPDLKEV